MNARRAKKTRQFTTPGEAETWDSFVNGDFLAAFQAAKATGVQIVMDDSDEYEWFVQAWENDALTALAQCCEEGVLLRPELREARMAPFPLSIRIAAEAWLREVPPSLRGDLLRFIYWFVRIERAARTGSPEFDRSRCLTVTY